MKKLKITMLGAGSGFVLTIARELLHDPVFADCEFTLMDIAQDRLAVAESAVKNIVSQGENKVTVRTAIELRPALEGADYVITSCEKNRYAYWVQGRT